MTIDPADARFQAAALQVEDTGPDFAIWPLDANGQRTDHILVRVAKDGTQMAFCPQRSAAQRLVLAGMGIVQ